MKQALLERLDEAIRLMELRRYRRILVSGRLPFVYAAGAFLFAWILVPLFLGDRGVIAGAEPLSQHRGWAEGVLLTISALGAGVGAFLRAQYLWQQERSLHGFQSWFLTRMDPRRAVLTTVFLSALLGLGLAVIPAGVGLFMGLLNGLRWWQYLLVLLILPLCALFGAALGAGIFFTNQQLIPASLLYPAMLAAALVPVGFWLRIETVEGGWRGRWEDHPARVGMALTLSTPLPWTFGSAAPTWWSRHVAPSLGSGFHIGWAAPLYACALLLGAGGITLLASRGYIRLARDPEQLEKAPQEARVEEIGREHYWKGFKNPVLTRDIRTRLRNKETAEFIFFASVAVALGAFVPLVMTASDLADPLQTARAARQVFFWLTMTLVALVTLLAPGLTADVLTHERATGTLEMLVGTSMRPREILVGKLLGAVCVLVLLVTPSLPLFGLCYLFHGADGPSVIKVYLLLFGTLVISALIGLTQSAIHTRGGMARFWAYACTMVFVGFPGGPFWIAAACAAPDAGMRQSLEQNAYIGAAMTIFWGWFLILFWGHAKEQLEYSEY